MACRTSEPLPILADVLTLSVETEADLIVVNPSGGHTSSLEFDVRGGSPPKRERDGLVTATVPRSEKETARIGTPPLMRNR